MGRIISARHAQLLQQSHHCVVDLALHLPIGYENTERFS